jgi:protein-tyrosine phosphatase
MAAKIRVLFVCSGNICRSPMADAVFRQMVADAGLSDRIDVDSAGTGSWHVGEAPHRGTMTILQQHNIPYDERARQFQSSDLSTFDYVLAMDSSHLSFMRRVGDNPPAEVAMFLSYANKVGTVQKADVPDPYYNGGFDAVYSLVERGCKALLDHIRAEHHL